LYVIYFQAFSAGDEQYGGIHLKARVHRLAFLTNRNLTWRNPDYAAIGVWNSPAQSDRHTKC
jgi:hypothetical protein